MRKLRKIIKVIALIGIACIILGRIYSCGKTEKPESKSRALVASAAEKEVTKNWNFNSNFFKIDTVVLGSDRPLLRVFCSNIPQINKITIEFIPNMGELNSQFQLYLTLSSGSPFGGAKFDTTSQSYHATYDTTKYTLSSIAWDPLFTGSDSFNFKGDLIYYAGDYVPGYGQGLQAGYQQGFIDGGEAAKYGIWANATVDGRFLYEINNQEVWLTENGMKPNFLTGGIYFDSIWKKYQTYNGENLERADITINFATPFSYDSNYDPIVKKGASDIYDGIFITADGKKFAFDFEYASEADYASKIVFRDKNVKYLNNIVAISLSIGRASDQLGEVTLVSRSNEYTAGYGVGYNEGLEHGKIEGKQEGYQQGYDKGVNDGYAKATEEGLNGSGIFYAAISMVRIFFQLFTQLMGTKIAGDITIGLIVIGLPAAFMIVDLAISLVRKFFGAHNGGSGGKADG